MMKRLRVNVTLLVVWGVLMGTVGCGQLDLPGGDPSPTPTLLPEATSTPDITADFVPYLSPELGIAFEYPAAWIIRDTQGLAIASDPALFDSTAGVTSGALLSFTPVAVEEENLVDALTGLIGEPADTRVVQPAAPVSLRGQEAAGMTLVSIDQTGVDFRLLFRLIEHQGATVLVSAVTPDYVEFQPVLEAIMDSVIVSAAPPTPAPPTLTPAPTATPLPVDLTPEPTAEAAAGEETAAGDVIPQLNAPIPADFVQFFDPSHLYAIGHPPAWLIDSDDLDAVIIASSEALLKDNLFGDGGATVWLFPHDVAVGDAADPVIILEQFIANFPIYDSFEALALPSPLRINGQSGATARYDATFQGAPIIADYFVVLRDGRFVVMVALIARDSLTELEPLIDGMAASILIQ